MIAIDISDRAARAIYCEKDCRSELYVCGAFGWHKDDRVEVHAE